MPNDDIQKLFQSLDDELVKENSGELELLRLLMEVTLTFRDEVKKDNLILTVDDTKTALDALNTHINNQKFPANLSDIQKRLAKLMIDTFILFKYQ